tara:strand:- start:152 stop:607 length:456 start_codon:yes stop_codon:yes gene_type:complete
MFWKCFNRNKNSYLDNIKWKDTIVYTSPIKYGKVIKVYDGDTITIASKLPFKNSPIYRFSVRLDGIDTPELKSKYSYEKQLAESAQKFLSDQILDKIVELREIKNEKYGRILAIVYLGDVNINELMIDKKHAIPYNGGTKCIPEYWKSNHT